MRVNNEQEGGGGRIIYSEKKNSLPLESIRDRALGCSSDTEKQLVTEKAFFFHSVSDMLFPCVSGNGNASWQNFHQKLFSVEGMLIHDWGGVLWIGCSGMLGWLENNGKVEINLWFVLFLLINWIIICLMNVIINVKLHFVSDHKCLYEVVVVVFSRPFCNVIGKWGRSEETVRWKAKFIY